MNQTDDLGRDIGLISDTTLTAQAEQPTDLLTRLDALRRSRAGHGATLAELATLLDASDAETERRIILAERDALRARVEELLDERDNHRYSPADPRLWQIHQLALEATRSGAGCKDTWDALYRLIRLALNLFPTPGGH